MLTNAKTTHPVLVNALERVGPYVVPGDDPEQPRHDLKRPWDAVTKRAGLTGGPFMRGNIAGKRSPGCRLPSRSSSAARKSP